MSQVAQPRQRRLPHVSAQSRSTRRLCCHGGGRALTALTHPLVLVRSLLASSCHTRRNSKLRALPSAESQPLSTQLGPCWCENCVCVSRLKMNAVTVWSTFARSDSRLSRPVARPEGGCAGYDRHLARRPHHGDRRDSALVRLHRVRRRAQWGALRATQPGTQPARAWTHAAIRIALNIVQLLAAALGVIARHTACDEVHWRLMAAQGAASAVHLLVLVPVEHFAIRGTPRARRYLDVLRHSDTHWVAPVRSCLQCAELALCLALLAKLLEFGGACVRTRAGRVSAPGVPPPFRFLAPTSERNLPGADPRRAWSPGLGVAGVVLLPGSSAAAPRLPARRLRRATIQQCAFSVAAAESFPDYIARRLSCRVPCICGGVWSNVKPVRRQRMRPRVAVRSAPAGLQTSAPHDVNAV